MTIDTVAQSILSRREAMDRDEYNDLWRGFCYAVWDAFGAPWARMDPSTEVSNDFAKRWAQEHTTAL